MADIGPVRAARRRVPVRTAGLARTRRRLFRPGIDRTGGAYGRTIAANRPSYRPNVMAKNYDQTVSLTLNSFLHVPTGTTASLDGGFLVGITQGTTDIQRIGRRIIVQTLEINGQVTFGGGTFSSDIVHIFVILDTQANGAFPAIADIFTTTAAGLQLRNLDNSQRFKTLKHYVVNVASPAYEGTAGNYAARIVNFHKFLKLNIPVEYSSTAGAIAEMKSNNCFLVMGAPNANTTMTLVTRVRFIDN